MYIITYIKFNKKNEKWWEVEKKESLERRWMAVEVAGDKEGNLASGTGMRHVG